MSRLTIGAVIAASMYASVAHAGQAEIAAQLNEEGKNLMFEKKYPEASAKFADAVARVPEAKYFFNLCMSRYQEGKFGEALTACNSVEKNGADDALKGKASKLTDKIKEEAQKQGIALQPTGGGGGETNVATDPNAGGGETTAPDPNGGGGNTTTVATPPPNGTGAPPAQPAFAVGRPPEQGVFVSTGPQHGYTWALGFDLFGGAGRVGQPDHYGNAAFGFRFKTDIMLMPKPKIGIEGYVQVTQLSQTANQMIMASTADQLSIVDLGLAAYKHFCPGRGRFCVTPLAGIQLALMSPASQNTQYGSVFSYAAAGARLEGTASIALGRHYEHVLSAQVGANIYTPVFASPSADSGPPASDPMIGLDQGGVAVYLGVGYTYRFNTPLGMMPFVTLE